MKKKVIKFPTCTSEESIITHVILPDGILKLDEDIVIKSGNKVVLDDGGLVINTKKIKK